MNNYNPIQNHVYAIPTARRRHHHPRGLALGQFHRGQTSRAARRSAVPAPRLGCEDYRGGSLCDEQRDWPPGSEGELEGQAVRVLIMQITCVYMNLLS
jgi:hypothetical protein